ncbi:LysR family transcriptional regulator [Vibrio sp. TRT 17S01]|uniref:LysR family transcriptional regulator n=1 Tax=Vibrio sp. TRT 17S01 TaxID=3418505 RepID=UPI003CEB2C1A
MLNPLWLNTFKTLIDVGHFTKTADTLHMTQPGVSQHIQKLEQACGHLLIQREKKRFELTEQGKLVYQYAKQCEASEHALFTQLAFDDPFAGVCKLASSGAVALSLYAPLLDLQCKYPNLIIELEAAPNHKIIKGIIEGSLDMGVVTHKPDDARLKVVFLANEPLCLILPPHCNATAITPEKLRELGLIRHPDAHHYLTRYFAQCRDENLMNTDVDAIPTRSYINQLSQILLPISKGLGFTVLPQSVLENFSDKADLTVHQPTDPVVEALYLIQKNHRQLPNRFHTIEQQIHHTLAAS